MGYTQDDVLKHLHQKGNMPTQINQSTVRSTTIASLERKSLIQKNGKGYELTELGERRATHVAENVDQPRQSRFLVRWRSDWTVTFDPGQADYEFWDRARRGVADGLQMAGLFLKPLASKKAAWVLGSLPKLVYDDPYTQDEMNTWLRSVHSRLLLAYEEAANLGDHYVVLNPDETVTLVAPHVVEPLVDDQDYSQHIGYKISQTYQHPAAWAKRQTVEDEFTTRGRVRRMKRDGQQAGGQQTFRLSLPFVPVVHIPNNQRANEIYGHPEGEALLALLYYYNEVLVAAIEGNLKQGRPVAVFEKMGSGDNLLLFLNKFALAKEETLPDGTTRNYYEVDFSSLIALGEDAEFNWKSPDPFTQDTTNILQLLFYLVVQHTELPEFIFGNAIQGSRASAETQLPPFTKWAEKEQGRAETWLVRLVQVAAAVKALVDPQIKADEVPRIKWAPLTTSDDKLTLEAIKVALTVGGWDAKDLVPYFPLDVDDPDEIIAHIEAMEEENRRLSNGEDQPFVPLLPSGDASADEENDNVPDTEQVRSLTNILNEQAHTGAIVKFEIPLDVATNLSSATQQSGLVSVPPEEMHITLTYLGEIEAIADQREAVEVALETVAGDLAPLHGIIGGIGRFNASEASGGQDVIYASFDSPDLPELRQMLVEAIEGTGIEISRQHGFTPHITLAYVDSGTAMPNLALETMPLRFDEIVLAWGDERKAFTLGSGEIADVMEVEDKELVLA